MNTRTAAPRRLLAACAAALALIASMGPAAGAEHRGREHVSSLVQESEVFRAEPGPDHGTPVEGASATLRRIVGPKGRLAFRLATTELNPGHAYTVWIEVHNRPEHCTGIAKIPGGSACGEMDWALPSVDTTTFLGAGSVAAEDGSAVFRGQLRQGDEGVHFGHEEGRDFTNVRGGDVALWVRDHGPYDPERYGDEQLTTFNGGCLNYVPAGSGDGPGDYPCSNQQVASFGGLE